MEEKWAKGTEVLPLQSVEKNHEHQKVLLKQLSKRQGGGKEFNGCSIPSESSGDDKGDTSNGNDSGSESESEGGSGDEVRARKGAKMSGDVSAANSQ